jgi:uncharacterized damage-inducible protein DinB
MRTLLQAVLICILAPATVALAQNKPSQDKPAAAQPQENPYSGFNRVAYARIKDILLRSAEKMPEENYSFKPTEAVRSYGQIIGHVADAQYVFCSRVLGEQNPAPKIEQTKTSKADLVAALKDSFAYCDRAFDGMSDASGTQTAKLFGGDTPKLDILTVNLMHDMEHYGNLVTYMRMKNIVPPTSEPPPQAQPNQPQPKK